MPNSIFDKAKQRLKEKVKDKVKETLKTIVGPESSTPTTVHPIDDARLTVQPPEVLTDYGTVMHGPGDTVEVTGNDHDFDPETYEPKSEVGAFAIAGPRHKPLPVGGEGSVLVPNGTRGVVRGMAATTVLVDFGPPIGLLHMNKADVFNVSGSGGRKRWGEISNDENIVKVAIDNDVVFLPASALEGWEYGYNDWLSLDQASAEVRQQWAKSQEQKLSVPIDGNVTADGHVLFNDGHHRAKAGRILGKKIPVRIGRNALRPEIWKALLDRFAHGFTLRDINPEGWNLNKSPGVPSLAALTAGRASGLPRNELDKFYREFDTGKSESDTGESDKSDVDIATSENNEITRVKSSSSTSTIVTAAILHAPPAMLKAGNDYIERAVKIFARDSIYDRIREAKNYPTYAADAKKRLDDITGEGWLDEIKALKPGDPSLQIDIPAVREDFNGDHLFIVRHKETGDYSLLHSKTERPSSWMNAPDDVFDAIVDIVRTRRQMIDRLLKIKTDPEMLKDLTKKKEEFAKLDTTGLSEPGYSEGALEATIPFDLTDWRYKDEMPPNLGSKDQIRLWIIKKEKEDRRGDWNPASQLIRVYVGNYVPSDDAGIARLTRQVQSTFEHEMTHVAQNLIQTGKRMEGPGGLPSGGGKDPYAFEKEHPKRPIEFYPNIVSEVNAFHEKFDKLGPIPADELKEFARQWVGDRSRFQALKEDNPRAWQKMVTEFMRAVLRDADDANAGDLGEMEHARDTEETPTRVRQPQRVTRVSSMNASATTRVSLTAATPRKVPAKPTNLIAVHNLNESNLLHADEIGGLISPSLAITKVSQEFENFGDITLVAPLSLVDPAHTPVFDADIYSARYPGVKYKPNAKEVAKIRKTFEDQIKRTDSYFDDAEDAIGKGGYEGLLRSSSLPALQLAFLEQVKGIEVPTPTRNKPVELDWARAPTMQKFLTDRGYDYSARPQDEVPVGGSTYYKDMSDAARKSVEEHWSQPQEGLDDEDRKYLTDSNIKHHFGEDNLLNFSQMDKLFRSHQNLGQTETDRHGFQDTLRKLIQPYEDEFKEWAATQLKSTQGERYLTSDGGKKMPYTPENVLKLMTKKLKGAENFNYGLGSLRALGAKRFTSIQQMEQHADKIVTKVEFDAKKEQNQDEFFALLDKLRPYHPAGDSLRFSDSLMTSLGESYKRGKSLWSELKKDGFQNVPDDLIKEVAQFRQDLVNMPTEYFEAKPQRLVGLNEFVGAVVPKDVPPRVIDVLKSNGLHVEFYDKTKSGTRSKAISKLQKTTRQAAHITRVIATQHHEAVVPAYDDADVSDVDINDDSNEKAFNNLMPSSTHQPPAPKPKDEAAIRRERRQQGPKVEKRDLIESGVEPGAGIENIRRVLSLATSEDIEYWGKWYRHSHDQVMAIADRTGIPFKTVAAMVAVLSPSLTWELNLDAAESLILGTDKPGSGRVPGAPSRGGFGANQAKAKKIMSTGDTSLVTGPKVEVFFQSIINPVKTEREIVLDGHAINIWRGEKRPLKGIPINDKEKAEMREDYRKVGEESGLGGQAVQAITWVIWRAMKVPKSDKKAVVTRVSAIEGRARRQGLTIEGKAFHVTPHLFEKLDADKSGLGTHFGTVGAAAERGLAKRLRTAPVARMLLFELNVKHPLVMTDIGYWEKPGYVIAELEQVLPEVSDVDRKWTWKDMREAIESAGYDSIAYVNEAEDKGSWSYIVWNPALIHQVDESDFNQMLKRGPEDTFPKDTLGDLPNPEDLRRNDESKAASRNDTRVIAVAASYDLSGTFYHGTRAQGIQSLRASTGGEFGPGVYLTSFEPTARMYAEHVASSAGEPTVLKVKTSARNPFVVEKTDWIRMTASSTPRTVQNRLKQKGYDSVIGIGINGYEWQLVVFDAGQTQIVSDTNDKSANMTRVMAQLTDTSLRRIGFQRYTGIINGHRVWIGADDIVAHGTFPEGKRQRRQKQWRVKIDGIEAGSAGSFREARALAMAGCTGKVNEAASTRITAQVSGLWYHGTEKQFGSFARTTKQTVSAEPGQVAIFFSPDFAFAKANAPGRDGSVITARLHLKNTFDARQLWTNSNYWPPAYEDLTPEGRSLFDDLEANRIFPNLVRDDESEWQALHDSGGLWASLLRNSYDVIEDPKFVDWLERNGYDSFYVTGDGPKNVGVLNVGAIEIINRVSNIDQKSDEASYVEDDSGTKKTSTRVTTRQASILDALKAELPWLAGAIAADVKTIQNHLDIWANGVGKGWAIYPEREYMSGPWFRVDMPISVLPRGKPWNTNTALEYAKMDPTSMPEITVEATWAGDDRHGSWQFRVLDGEHRIYAARQSKRATVPAYVGFPDWVRRFYATPDKSKSNRTPSVENAEDKANPDRPSKISTRVTASTMVYRDETNQTGPLRMNELKPDDVVRFNFDNEDTGVEKGQTGVITRVRPDGPNIEVSTVVRLDGDSKATTIEITPREVDVLVDSRDPRLTTVAFKREEDEEGSHAGIFIPIPASIARDFPPKDEEDKSPPHFTVLYLGPTSLDQLDEIEAIVKEIAATTTPFEIEFSPGVEWFENDEGQQIAHKGVTAATLVSLKDLHDRLRSKIEAAKIPCKHKEGFIAHATLAYLDDREYEGPIPEGSFPVDTLEVWGFTPDIAIKFGKPRLALRVVNKYSTRASL